MRDEKRGTEISFLKETKKERRKKKKQRKRKKKKKELKYLQLQDDKMQETRKMMKIKPGKPRSLARAAKKGVVATAG